MADSALAAELAGERASAIRALLADPLLDAMSDDDRFATIARHHEWLVDWFDTTCGWRLIVDRQGSFARLQKRRALPDPHRPIRRLRGSRAPFDRRRYELFCHICAELITPPITTIGLLAQRLAASTVDRATPSFDTSKRRERAAFVDCILLLIDLGAITVDGGDLDAFLDDPAGNAFIHTDVSRLHCLLATDTPPSRIGTDDPVEALVALGHEPRFATDDAAAEADDRRNRRLRQAIARRLLDDPTVHLDDLTEDERRYLESLSGRQWLRARVAESGMDLELRAEGALAIDRSTEATDVRFPAANGNVWQVALLLVDSFVSDSGDRRQLVDRTPTQIESSVADLLRKHPKWAKRYRADGGPAQLAAEATEVLAGLGLVRVSTGLVEPLPAIARYRVGAVTTDASSPNLFELGEQ